MYATPSFLFFHAKPRNKMCSISISLLMFIVTQLLCLHTDLAIPTSTLSHFSKFSREPALGLQPKLTTKTPEELFDQSVNLSQSQAQSTRALASSLNLSSHTKAHEMHLSIDGGMVDCIELLDDSLDQLSNIINHKGASTSTIHSFDDDVQTWLSAALTNQETCLESLGSQKGTQLEKKIMASKVRELRNALTNTLTLYISTKPTKANNYKAKSSSVGGNVNRRLLYHKSNDNDNFPRWVSPFERKLLEASIDELDVNAVVDKRGSGTHRTIGEAINGALAGEGRSVIHIKAGVYNENLKFSTKQKNVMLVGDGKGKSVIVDDRNAEEGWTTFQSATVAAMGDGFIARDITFVNSAGPSKGQAVALRVGSDKSVIFRCSILGYQDTLYTHSKRQFYRETDIYGTVDFIFGNSAVVFQNCNIYARKPSSNGQSNYVTAQGRSNENQNTGISIHNCRIQAASDLAPVKSKIATYLGRPWQQYSRTVIMQSFMDDAIHPSGWSPWSGNFALKTLFYGEYMNSGPGASTSRRVTWPGYKGSLTSLEAQAFTVASFISGNLWLPSTGVEFDSGLIG